MIGQRRTFKILGFAGVGTVVSVSPDGWHIKLKDIEPSLTMQELELSKIWTCVDEDGLLQVTKTELGRQVIEIKVTQIRDIKPARRAESASRIAELCRSIKEEGMKPGNFILVAQTGKGSYMVIDGWMRYKAILQLGWEKVNVALMEDR
jgi:hypothetical protein